MMHDVDSVARVPAPAGVVLRGDPSHDVVLPAAHCIAADAHCMHAVHAIWQLTHTPHGDTLHVTAATQQHG
jgi:hypothetical protein